MALPVGFYGSLQWIGWLSLLDEVALNHWNTQRSGRNLEIQDFNMAIKTYLQRSDKGLNCLMVYAKAFRIEKIIRQYMEVLL